MNLESIPSYLRTCFPMNLEDSPPYPLNSLHSNFPCLPSTFLSLPSTSLLSLQLPSSLPPSNFPLFPSLHNFPSLFPSLTSLLSPLRTSLSLLSFLVASFKKIALPPPSLSSSLLSLLSLKNTSLVFVYLPSLLFFYLLSLLRTSSPFLSHRVTF